ncbi:MAG: polysaccharide biosynthesis/export protein [Acidobacteriota bacterium]|jgi:polysaccharide export outer membrane protein|nr:polysaccharide biosynthesis/export protein [Acidobacteriota bacterium]
MKMKRTLKAIALALTITATVVAQSPQQTRQQSPQDDKQQRGGILGKIFGQDPKTKKDAPKQETPQKDASAKPSQQATGRLEPGDTKTLPSDVSAEAQAGRREQKSEEEAAVLPYYNNFLKSYHVGPEDVISVTVFGQDRYSKSGITVPPNGKISYPLIPEGVVVVGKTTEQIQEEMTKRLDEYIIDPQITVSLDKAVSATYSVIGDVGQPGIRIMTHRYSITEALAMAGGVLNTGDKSKVFILRQQADGNVKPILVNVKEIERGRAKEMAFLVPGDQVVVPGNRLKKIKMVMDMLPVLNYARIFTGGW